MAINLLVMKYLVSLWMCLIAVAPLVAQWEINPSDPGVVCNAEGNQGSLSIFPDSDGGLYMYWLDDRDGADSTALYGQHYDSDGNVLWEENGRLIWDDSLDVPLYRILRMPDSGRMFIVWYSDRPELETWHGLYMQELGPEGEFLWEENLFIAEENYSGALSAFQYLQVELAPGEEDILVKFDLTTFGYVRMRYTRVSQDGELTGPFSGMEIGPLSYGSSFMVPDNHGGAYVLYSTGNGMGAGLMLNRVDDLGNPLWSDWVTATNNTPGLGYQFSAAADSAGITVAIEVSQSDIYAMRFDTLGTSMWENPLIVCDAAGTSNGFRMGVRDSIITMIWRDTRPGAIGNYAVYGQRFTTEGEILWPEDGLQISNDGGYDAAPVFGYGDEESIVVLNSGNGVNGPFDRAHKVMPDGSKPYGDEGITYATGAYSMQTLARRPLLVDNHIIAIWQAMPGPSLNDLHVSLIETLLTYVEEEVVACNVYAYNDEFITESGTYVYELPGDTVLTLNVTIIELIPSIEINGNVMTAFPSNAVQYVWVDCNTGEAVGAEETFIPSVTGSYNVFVSDGTCTVGTDCEFIEVVSVSEIERRDVLIYPNPGEQIFRVSVPSGGSIDRITIRTAQGQVVDDFRTGWGSTADVEVPHLAAGLYLIEVESGGRSIPKRWIRQ